jgi:hypothetical protein
VLTTPTRRVLAARAEAIAQGDLGMVRECDAQLARWGVDPDLVEGVPETVTPARGERRPERRRTRAGAPLAT